jgi:ParB family transcriptional regulator, chromosome partitioning protein
MKPQSSIEPRGLTQYCIHGIEEQKIDRNSGINAVQEKQRREDALADAIGLRVLSAIAAAVPARLTKRDLIFIVERILVLLGKRRVEVLARSCGIKQVQGSDSIWKLMDAYIRKANEGELGRILVEIVILQFTRTQSETGKVFKEAAQYYKVNTDAIAIKVKTEFASKEKAQAGRKTTTKATQKSARLTAVKGAKAA